MTHAANDKPMRIYFVGSHATGKTTMTRWVSRRYGLPMITEVARAVLAELETNFDTLRTDMERVGDYQRRVFERQIAIERMQDKGFVSDRAFDNLAYAAEHAMVLGDIMAEDSGVEVRSYMEWVSNGLVFFVRPHRSLLKEDGVRAGVDWDSVVRIDGMVKLLLEQFRIRYLPIDTPSMQERIRAVEFVLSRLGMEQQQQLPVVDHYLPPQRVVTLLKR
ncbi:MAG: AAA family ATPase [Myxococcales bacterium]|nr:AAA family ATPase [Myxococcales bacterium]